MPRCPFYGKHAVPLIQVLVEQGGNECALITASYSPCRVEMAGGAPDLENCELNGSRAALDFAGYETRRRLAGSCSD